MSGEAGEACVSVVDDDALVLKALKRLLSAEGFRVRTFGSPQEFLSQPADDAPGCVVVDLAMPGIDGLELQSALAGAGDARPVIFISGHADVASGVGAMKAGAVDFLTKPFQAELLLAAVRVAIERNRVAREARKEHSYVDHRLASLTRREREVLDGVVAGRLNKQIALHLGTAEKTVKVHRAHMMQKMGVGSLADLVRLVDRGGARAARAARN